MTIAIVIGTHGWAAEQLLKTAEMLLGEQENVGWIDFVPGENAETLTGTQPETKLGKVEVHRERTRPIQLHKIIAAILGIIGFPEVHEPEVEPIPVPAELVGTRHLIGKSIEHPRI